MSKDLETEVDKKYTKPTKVSIAGQHVLLEKYTTPIEEEIPINDLQKEKTAEIMEQEITKQRSLLNKIKGLKGAGYRMIKSYTNKILDEQMAKIKADNEIRRQIAIETAKQRNKIIIQQTVAKNLMGMQIEKAKHDMAMKMKIKAMQQYYQQPVFNQFWPPPMKRQPIKRSGRRRIVQQQFIPPHDPMPNFVTGVCRICGKKHMRLL